MKLSILKYLLIALLLIGYSSVAVADTTKPFNASDMIFEHLGDSYQWHICTIEEKEISIPLPVILKSDLSGWHCFLSSDVEHGQSYDGFYIASSGPYKDQIVELDPFGKEIRPLDLSLTKNALSIWITVTVMMALFLSMASNYKKRGISSPKGLYALLEPIILFIYNQVIKPSIGEKGDKYAPYLLTVFFFIWITNLLGLLPIFPGGANVTGNIAVTMILALISFLIVNFSGSKHYWKDIFWGDVPTWLKVPIPLIPVIELFGIFTKPFALMVRLFANILSGHIIQMVLFSLIFIFGAMSWGAGLGISVVSIAFSFFMKLLEVLVVSIQAYVFTLLTALFIGLAVQEPKAEKKTNNNQS